MRIINAAAFLRAKIGYSLKRAFLGESVGLRLIKFIILFSSVVTLFFTSLQLYWDYRRDVSLIEKRMAEIEQSYLGSLAGSLWQMDLPQVRLQIEGILRLPDIQSVEVAVLDVGPAVEKHSGKNDVVTVGVSVSSPDIMKKYPIIYNFHGKDKVLGVVAIQASFDAIYQRLQDKVLEILITQGMKTFIVSLFTLFIFSVLVTRHLRTIAEFANQFNLEQPSPPLRLARASIKRGRSGQAAPRDELDQVVSAFNNLCGGLEQTYNQLRSVNAELKADNEARRRAEEEIKRLNIELSGMNSQLEVQVRRRTHALEVSNRELNAFSYSVSHDLRAPLRRIDGFGQILLEDCAHLLGVDGQRYVERIRNGVREMNEMVDSFLKLSRCASIELVIESHNLSDMASDIFSRLREKDPDRQVQITIQPDLVALVDRRMMRSALENLLENAWKYTRHTLSPVISIGSCVKEGKTIYYVRDNGAGFDMAYAERLFSPFYRLHSAEEFEGSGIGLATVQRIIVRHGGAIWVDASMNNGATFFFTLQQN
ncbi:Histidine kinase [Azospirillaceae bacterium]